MLWVIFGIAVTAMLALDLGVFHRRAHVVAFREALGWSAAWFTLAFLFMWVVYYWRGSDDALAFLAGYLIEWSLSADNIFVFLMIFSYFRVPPEYQHKVLFWGILGAIVMRAIMITAGVVLIHRIEWIVYIFGAFLVITGIRMATQRIEEIHPERNPVLRLVRRLFPVTKRYQGSRFMVRRMGRLAVTPLFVVLTVVESTDLVFAIDSVPAVLAISTDPFIVITSNVFAILGLRSLYFVVAGMMQLFRYLKYGLSLILVFVGFKMIASQLIEIPVALALGIVATILLASIAASLLFPKAEADTAPDSPRRGGR
ncbi:MAG: membrane protein [Gemmatimonadales bacterium]|nr:MAG: membrane protein [Gemmatimonadales bacterium]